MKFLHTADLHLGRTLNNINLLEDQRYVLEQMLDLVQSEHTDGVLIAGDVYQKSTPSAEAQELFGWFLEKLAELKQQVFVINGNHDSDKRISYLSPLVRKAGVHLSQSFRGCLQTIRMEDEYGPLAVHLLPFVKLSQIRAKFPTENIPDLETGVRRVLAASDIRPEERNVLVCHQLVLGAERCDSEDPVIGTVENIGTGLFEPFDYVALGHIHIPQHTEKKVYNYAGSPLPYSFTEIIREKSVSLVEIREKGACGVQRIPIVPLHPMEDLTGTLDEILSLPSTNHYMRITLTDDALPFDSGHQLRTHFPNLMKIIATCGRHFDELDELAQKDVENQTLTQLYTDFCMIQGYPVPTDTQLSLLEKLMAKYAEDN